MRPLGGWKTTGHWKGKLGYRSVIDYIELALSSLKPTTTTKSSLDVHSVIAQAIPHKVHRQNVVAEFAKGTADLLIEIPWKKFFKLVAVISVLIVTAMFIMTLGSVMLEKRSVTQQQIEAYEAHQAELKKEYDEKLEMLHNRYMKIAEEAFTVTNGKLEDVKNFTTEIEQKLFLYEHHIPVIVKYPQPYKAEIRSGKNKGKVVIINP